MGKRPVFRGSKPIVCRHLRPGQCVRPVPSSHLCSVCRTCRSSAIPLRMEMRKSSLMASLSCCCNFKMRSVVCTSFGNSVSRKHLPNSLSDSAIILAELFIRSISFFISSIIMPFGVDFPCPPPKFRLFLKLPPFRSVPSPRPQQMLAPFCCYYSRLAFFSRHPFATNRINRLRFHWRQNFCKCQKSHLKKRKRKRKKANAFCKRGNWGNAIGRRNN